MERKYIYIYIRVYIHVRFFETKLRKCKQCSLERTPRYLISVVRNHPPRKALGPIWLNDETRVDSELWGRREA